MSDDDEIKDDDGLGPVDDDLVDPLDLKKKPLLDDDLVDADELADEELAPDKEDLMDDVESEDL